ncbi:MAG TPA: hypothetical protein VM076_22695 [Gemmatimonadaceae bacterium]|nr:hypothetical protein [Gemmatimonadaceae bacterium]
MSVVDTGYLAGAAFRADCAEIVRTLDIAQAKRTFEANDARDAVERCARAARAAGVLPEKLIIELKALMRDVALPEMRAWYRAVLTDRVIVWAIEAFYNIGDTDAPTEKHGGEPR